MIRPLLRCHNLCYRLAGRFASILNGGKHPKHQITNYKQWFLDNIEQDWTVIDVGCNVGMMSEVLAQKAGFVYGLEIDSEYVKKAERESNSANVKYICADVTEFDYSKIKPVDCIVLSNVLEHIENRVDFLTRIVRKVIWNEDDEKTILIRVPAIDREWITLYKKQIGLEYRLDQTHYSEYTTETLKEELDHARINILSIKRCFGEIYAVCKAR